MLWCHVPTLVPYVGTWLADRMISGVGGRLGGVSRRRLYPCVDNGPFLSLDPDGCVGWSRAVRPLAQRGEGGVCGLEEDRGKVPRGRCGGGRGSPGCSTC